jgi:hypothetical protein
MIDTIVFMMEIYRYWIILLQLPVVNSSDSQFSVPVAIIFIPYGAAAVVAIPGTPDAMVAVDGAITVLNPGIIPGATQGIQAVIVDGLICIEYGCQPRMTKIVYIETRYL